MAAAKKRPSLSEVAQYAGVSPATVSRVLNNSSGVRDAVRERVLGAVSVLGYQPTSSHSATLLRRKTVALLIPDILNPYFTEIVRGVQNEAAEHGYLPLLLDTAEDPAREHEFLRMLAGQPVGGIIACGSRISLQDLVASRSHITTPMVVVNRCVGLPNLACIMVDLETATRRAARHLLDLGHTRIAFLPGPSQAETSQARRRGIEQALAECGLTLRPDFCPPSFPDVDGGFQAMAALLAYPRAVRPTGIITHNDLMALGALHAIRVHHLRVPEDISVIGIDDIAMAAHANPPLTTLAPPKYRMGRTAMQLLRRLIEGQPLPEEGYTLVECPLVVRESTAPVTSVNGHGLSEN